MTRRRVICGAVVAGLLVAGCGTSTHQTATSSTASTASTGASQTVASGAAVLEHAVVAAIDTDHKTSVTALWTNTVPAKVAATAGPALSELRKSVAGRRKRGIRVRMVHETFRVLSTTLAPSYTTATAVISDIERVQPTHKNGKPLGKSVTLHERADLELHRVAGSNRFVVWRVQVLK